MPARLRDRRAIDYRAGMFGFPQVGLSGRAALAVALGLLAVARSPVGVGASSAATPAASFFIASPPEPTRPLATERLPRLTLRSLRLECLVSRAQAGDTWTSDFDRGWRHGEGVEMGGEVDVEARGSWWRAHLGWRGRWSEHLAARGRLTRATLGARVWLLEAQIGRGYPYRDWVPTQDAGLLFSLHPPAIDHLAFRAGALPLPGGAGSLWGESFAGYLDDGDRVVPYPLLWGMRLAWCPSEWLTVEAQRSVMLGGAGRTQKLDVGDLWDIFLGRGEGARGPNYAPKDSDQKFAWMVRLHPREPVRAIGLADAELVWFYGGEDRFERLFPMAPGRFHGLRVHPSDRWGLSLAYASNPDDQNRWYYHKIYRTGYTYRGYIIGHPMGGDARRWRATICWTTDRGARAGIRLTKERFGYFWTDRGWDPVEPGGFFTGEFVLQAPWGPGVLQATVGGAHPWGAGRSQGRNAAAYARIGVELARSGYGSRLELDPDFVWGMGP